MKEMWNLYIYDYLLISIKILISKSKVNYCLK